MKKHIFLQLKYNLNLEETNLEKEQMKSNNNLTMKIIIHDYMLMNKRFLNCYYIYVKRKIFNKYNDKFHNSLFA